MKAARYSELRAGTRVDMLAWLHKHEMVEPLFALVQADSNHDVFPLAKRDLKVLLSVHLPGRQRQRGPISGERLRSLRCQKLAELDREQGRAPQGHGDSDAPLELPGD